MNILLLKGFNNYFNRIVKKYSTLADYKSNSSSFLEFSSINFNPNDGVATSLIIGNPTQTEGDQVLFWEYNGTPDYLIAYDTGDGVNLIRSRWFVLESERTRAGQYRIALKRDVLAENFNKIMNTPCFVEKGSISSVSNPLLYNNESLTYNEIKTAEYPLKDTTGTGWIVGYLAKNRANTPVQVSTQIALIDGIPIEYIDEEDLPFEVDPDAGTSVYSYTPDNLSIIVPGAYLKNGSWGNFYLRQGYFFHNVTPSKLNLQFNSIEYVYGVAGDNIGQKDPLTFINEQNGDKFLNAGDINITDGANNAFKINSLQNSTNINVFGKKYFYSWDSPLDHDQSVQAPASSFETLNISSSYVAAIKTLVNGYMQNDGYGNTYGNDIKQTYDNKYVKIGNNYYRMSITETNVDRYDVFLSNSANNAQPTFTALNNNICQRHIKYDLNTPMVDVLTSIQNNNSSDVSTSTYLKPGCGAIAISKGYNVVLSRISTETIEVTLQTGKRITYDCPANLFAIPYGTFKFKTADDSDTFTTQKEEGLALARAIASTLGASVCYDIQLVPYVPSQLVRDLMENSDTLNLTDLESANYDVVTRTSIGVTSTASFVLYPSSCKGTFDIYQTINKYNNQSYSTVLNAKISNETQLCRLVSPNFNSMFEFSLAKNNGVSKFNVDYTYKPLMPYIHVNPDFKFIYGQDWDDARGLILGGDFSLTFINDAWVNYENNNKNYQAIFNRQIENMDVNNQIVREQQNWQRIAGYFGGGIGGAAGGAMAGAKLGGGYGAIAGAVGGAYMGTVGSIIGGEMDREWLQRQQAETKDYAIDMYGYQLGNIKAMPYSLSRSESLTNNNKIYPIVELYEPTEIEIENLVNKINYNGMTIMAIGKLTDYATSADFPLTFVKGQLIRLDNLNDDFHVADAIYQEVNKGFYIPQEGN